ncbi:hypothetical protein V6N13_002992 [Hibiscus sabdariffa]|uniref:Uncharacterized protein n=2 Tax=Hibiscus sabdariffa TaxID=183260 RepID=A0ABR2AU48_9ROSI
MEAKTPVDNSNHDDEEDEDKINAFFTLVRNIRDVRNQMLIVSQGTKEKQKSAAATEEMKSTWTPSFQWEDFVQDHRHLTNNSTFIANATLPGSSKNNVEQKSRTHEHQDLDLNLSL